MPDQTPTSLLAHGAEQLSLVTVDAYNAELRSAEGFVGYYHVSVSSGAVTAIPVDLGIVVHL